MQKEVTLKMNLKEKNKLLKVLIRKVKDKNQEIIQKEDLFLPVKKKKKKKITFHLEGVESR